MELPDGKIGLNEQDNSGMTGLMHACQRNRGEVVRLLVQSPKIDKQTEDNLGKTAHDIAVERGYEGLQEIVSQNSESSP